MIDYYSGQVAIACSTQTENRGDLNLNGIAYEIADYVLYVNYFQYGLGVFTVNLDDQIAASEVNGDDIPLTVRDLVYLYRVIIGDVMPIPGLKHRAPGDSALFVQDTVAHTIFLQYPDSLAAAYLIFVGEVAPELAGGDMTLAYAFDDTLTRVLIYPTGSMKYNFREGLLLNYTGSGQLVSAEVADYYDAIIPAGVTVLTEPFWDRGDLNLNGISNEIADYVLYANYFLYGISVFEIDVARQIAASDVNADGIVLTLRDFIYLYRIIIGDTPPIPKPRFDQRVDTARFMQDTTAHTVTLEYPDSLAAAYLVFTGEVTPELAVGNMLIAWESDSNTVVLIYPFGPGKVCFGEGLLLTYTGSGCLVSAEVADYNDAVIPTSIVGGGEVTAYRGDLNLNYIPYEFADYVVYTNYFIYGLAAFEIDVDAQTAASDVNADGLPLSLADYVYLYRVIIGDAPPIPKFGYNQSGDTAFFFQDTIAQTVTLEYSDSLTTAYLTFSGEIVPELASSEMTLSYAFDSDETQVLISPFTLTKISFGEGLLFSYTGSGNLIDVAVADYSGASIPTKSFGPGDDYVCGDADGNDIVEISDAVYLINYIFVPGAPVPDPMKTGDPDCNEVVEISDAVFLINYIFVPGAPAPCDPDGDGVPDC